MKRPVPFHAVAGAAYAALALQAAWRLPPAGFTLCPFKLVTGHNCPGCGIGHSIVYAMRGDLQRSFHAHPLGFPLLAVWTVWLILGGANLLRGREFSDGVIPELRRPLYAWSALVLVLIVFIGHYSF